MTDANLAEQPADEPAHDRIVEAAARLVEAGGLGAATTRAVADAAGVQAPAIYRAFGDKRGLLDAVAEHVMARFVATKAKRRPPRDPVRALREGWANYVDFGLAHPGVFAILTAEPGKPSAAKEAGMNVLRRKVHALAVAGRLRVAEERAVQMLHAAGVGVVLALLAKAEDERDPGLSNATCEAVLAAITGEAHEADSAEVAQRAASLAALLGETTALTPAERRLLAEWLGRIASA